MHTSSRLEEETEWYHTPFRKYDASIGRFTGVDALASSMASINSYHYAYNNPVNFSDPAGLRPRPTHDDMNPSGESSSGGFMRTLRRIAAAFGYGGGGISGYKESSGSNGTFARGGTDGQDDFMNNPYTKGTDAYSNEQQAILGLAAVGSEDALQRLGAITIYKNGETQSSSAGEWTTEARGVDAVQVGLDGTGYGYYYTEDQVFTPRAWDSNPYDGLADGNPDDLGLYLAYDIGTALEHLWGAIVNENEDPSVATGTPPDILPVGPAKLTTNGIKLTKWLASRAQMAETGRVILRNLKDGPRLAKLYGGSASDWVKMTSSSFSKYGKTFETHWYQNIKSGAKVEYKTKLIK